MRCGDVSPGDLRRRMKRQTAGTWVLASAPILIICLVWNPSSEAAAAFKLRRNSTLVPIKEGLTPQASVGVPRRLPSPWRGKLGRGRPRTTTTTTTTEAITTTEEPPTFSYNTSVSDDAYRAESSEDASPLSVVWPLRARPAKRFRIPTPTTPEPQLLLKLLQPKPTRPAIYSLDGFVPKPSIRRVVATEPPLHFAKNLQSLASVPRRRKQYHKQQYQASSVDEDAEDEEDDLQSLGRRRKKPVSRYTAFARKGVPGEDFPVFTFIPQTDFDCGPQPGLYADPFTDCQVWHMCPGGNLSPRHSFLCPNGTIFNQKKRICDWWYNVDCRKHTRRIRADLLLD